MVGLDLHFKKISIYRTEIVWRGEKDCGMMTGRMHSEAWWVTADTPLKHLGIWGKRMGTTQ